MSQQIIKLVEQSSMKEKVDHFEVGDTVDVHTKILEGNKERIQIFSGTVIGRSGGGTREMFIVRRIVGGEGVERKFPVHSPRLKRSKSSERAWFAEPSFTSCENEAASRFAFVSVEASTTRFTLGHEFIMSQNQSKLNVRNRVSRLLSSRLSRIQRALFAGFCFLGLTNRKKLPATNTGQAGEDLAEAYLRKLGYRIVASRHRTPRHEIDLIAIDQKTIVFVEVKTWSRAGDGGPSDRVEADKQTRLTKAALEYLKSKRLLEHPARFDVIEVLLTSKDSDNPTVRHFINAFEAVGRYQMFA